MPRMIILSLLMFSQALPLAQQSARPNAGDWDLVEIDAEGTQWHARMKLMWRGERDCAGSLDWFRSADTLSAGREECACSFNVRGRTLLMRGTRVVDKRFDLAPGSYRAQVALGGTRIEKGTWSGDDAVPGSWSATWIKGASPEGGER